MSDELKGSGRFAAMLKRTNKQIKDDRAEAIAEDIEMAFKRQVEDLQIEVKRCKRARENMLDLSPDSAMSLKPAKDIDAQAFVDKDMEFGLQLREMEIKLEIAQKRYDELFGAAAEEVQHGG